MNTEYSKITINIEPKKNCKGRLTIPLFLPKYSKLNILSLQFCSVILFVGYDDVEGESNACKEMYESVTYQLYANTLLFFKRRIFKLNHHVWKI